MTTDGPTDSLGVTPGQTAGPFLHIGLPYDDAPYVVPEGTPGAIRVHGTVVDGAGTPVSDALVEIWQADPDGRFEHPDDPRGAIPARVQGFRGFGRCPTDEAGHYAFVTVKPGRVPAENGWQAPHLDVAVFARGLLHHLVTRAYFPDEADDNAHDPVLAALPPDRRETLVAVPDADGVRFDIRLQGDHETVFFLV
ncbi:MAG: protocatechuate 3,4-dioxygenase subunit alpha [Streptosporangiales bacterium]|nr:protocatechuate 3,4-dioxygenase subunit alpha [Streptosporangiales bacterium]MBO0891702.1 protocatechuate 3,4-dioxygenase subunit alpha [Acidothermales bacterium]